MAGRSELAADTVNGVYVCENAAAESESKEILKDWDFYEALETNRARIRN